MYRRLLCAGPYMGPPGLYVLSPCVPPLLIAPRPKLGSLSNRTLLVNNLLDLALYAGNRVVSAVGMEPPHDGRSRVRPPKVSRAVRIGRNEPTRMASPTSR